MNPAEEIWMDGKLVPWDDARVHVLTHALHYGTGVYEGLRAYETPRGTAIFRHDDHLDRLFRSAAVYLMDIPYTREELRAATHETIVRNRLPACYIRPLVYRGAGPMGLYPLDCPVNVAIAHDRSRRGRDRIEHPPQLMRPANRGRTRRAIPAPVHRITVR